MTIEDMKKKIDGMTYTELFSAWRFHPVGDPLFQGDVGKYFAKVMTEMRDSLPEGEHTRISKELGW